MCSICYVSGYENIPQQTSLKQLKMLQSTDKSSSYNFSWAVSGFKHFCLNDMCILRCWQQFSPYSLFANLHTDLLLVEPSKLWKQQAKMNFSVRRCTVGWEEFIHKNLKILASSSFLMLLHVTCSHSVMTQDQQQRAVAYVRDGKLATCSAIPAVAFAESHPSPDVWGRLR